MVLGLSTLELDNIMDTINCLQLLVHRVLIFAGFELRQFLAFSTWLRQEIEIQSTDPPSHESNEKDVHVDHASTLEYIRGAMLHSRLNEYFNNDVQSDKRSEWDLAAQGRSLYELYKRELKGPSTDAPGEKQLPGLGALIAHLDAQCNLVFARISETQRRNVRFGSLIPLGNGVPACMDMKMLVEVRIQLRNHSLRRLITEVLGCQRNEIVCSICCVRAKKRAAQWHVLPWDAKRFVLTQKLVRISRIELTIENGMSSTRLVEHAFVRSQLGYVQDMKFVDDQKLMLGVSQNCKKKNHTYT